VANSAKSSKSRRRDPRGGSAAAAQHLLPHRWKPGQSGNPNGAPTKARRMSDEIRAILDMEIPPTVLYKLNKHLKKKKLQELESGVTFRQAVAFQLIVKGMGGDVTALREVGDRDEGRPTQRVEVESKEDRDITIRIIEENQRDPSRRIIDVDGENVASEGLLQ
jgi:hypothetical protein